MPCSLIPPHVRCCARCLFISNIVTFFVPDTASSFASARISRRFSGFCSPCSHTGIFEHFPSGARRRHYGKQRL